MARKKKLLDRKHKNIQDSFEKMFKKSLRKLEKNKEDIENALTKLLTDEEIKVTEAEYNELKQLTKTMEEIDSVLENI